MIRLAVFFLIGNALSQQFNELPGAVEYLAALLVWLGARWLVRGRYTFEVLLDALLWAGLGSALFVAAATTEMRHWLVDTPIDQDLVVVGSVTGVPSSNQRRTRFEFQIERTTEGMSGVSPSRVYLSWYGVDTLLEAGQRWQLRVRLQRPRGLSNPAGFDAARWSLQQRIHATGYVRDSAENQRLGSARFSIHKTRKQLADLLQQGTTTYQQTGLMQALLLGVRVWVPDDTWALLTATGTGHLLAISGLHIGLMAGIAMAVVKMLWRFMPSSGPSLIRQDVAGWVALALAGVYAAMAGFTIPTRRALIMLSVLLGGRLLRRRWSSVTQLTIALMLVLLIDPLATLSAGFWLSFAAVLMLLLLARRLSTGGRHGWAALQVHGGLAVLMFPLSAVFFGQGSLVAPLANFIAVPWVSILVVPVLLLWALLALSLPPVAAEWSGQVLLLWVDGALTLLLRLLQLLQQWLPVAISVPSVGLAQASLALLGAILVCLPNLGRVRWLALSLWWPLLSPLTVTSTGGALEIGVLDVGQGLAVVVRYERRALLYDTGGRVGQRQTIANSIIVPYLRENRVRRLDQMVISHADSDHSAGWHSILSAMPVGAVIGPDGMGLDTGSACRRGQGWDWGAVRFDILHPGNTDPFGRNDRSCTLRIRFAEHTIVLPGDLEAVGERRLVARLQQEQDPLGPISLLLAPHHGSRTSSTPAFVDALRPRIVVYSVGYRNRFGFPHDSVRMRYKLQGSREYRTDLDGALVFRFFPGADVGEPRRHRKATAHFWQ